MHKSSEWSSLISGPGLISSPPETKNPGVFSWAQQQPFKYKPRILEMHLKLRDQQLKMIMYLMLFSHSVMYDSAISWTAACQSSLSLTISGVYANSCPLSQWCHPTISSSVVPFSSCPQSFPASGSFQMSQLFASSGQNISASTLASILVMNIQSWFPLWLTGLISLLSKGLSRVFSNTTVWKHQFFGAHPSLWSNSHIHTLLLEKPELWLYRPFSEKWCLCFLIRCLGLS